MLIKKSNQTKKLNLHKYFCFCAKLIAVKLNPAGAPNIFTVMTTKLPSNGEVTRFDGI